MLNLFLVHAVFSLFAALRVFAFGRPYEVCQGMFIFEEVKVYASYVCCFIY
jgi:hypothetical protein